MKSIEIIKMRRAEIRLRSFQEKISYSSHMLIRSFRSITKIQISVCTKLITEDWNSFPALRKHKYARFPFKRKKGNIFHTDVKFLNPTMTHPPYDASTKHTEPNASRPSHFIPFSFSTGSRRSSYPKRKGHA